MKTAINKYFALLFLFLLSASFASSQMREPEQVPLKYNGVDSTMFSSTDSNFKSPNKLIIGFIGVSTNASKKKLEARGLAHEKQNLFYYI